MSDPLQGSQSQASLLGPGIVGLFIQGIESGLVFAQFSQWFNAHDRREGSLVFIIVMFVTAVGLYVSSEPEQCGLIIIYEVRRLVYTLHPLGLYMYSNLGFSYVSPSAPVKYF